MELDEEDTANMKRLLEAATEMVVTFNIKPEDEWKELDFAKANDSLDFMKFIISGIMYSNGMSVCVCGECDDDEE